MTSADEQRDALLAAGRSLALRYALDEIDTVQICSEARLSPDAFELHFENLSDYLVAVQQQFMDEIRDRIFKVTSGMPTGIARIKIALEVYLESCLAERALRTWLLEGRTYPAVAAALRRQNLPYVMVVASELLTMGWPRPQAVARLLVAMGNETATAEHRMGQALPELREGLWDFAERTGPRAQ